MLLLRLSNLLLALGAFLGNADRSRMHSRIATYCRMKRHRPKFRAAEGAHSVMLEVIGGLAVLKVAPTPKPPISSRRGKIAAAGSYSYRLKLETHQQPVYWGM